MLRSFARIRKVTSVVLATAGLAVCAASAQAAPKFVTGVGHVNGDPSVTRTMSTPLNPSLRSSLAWRQYLAERRRRDSQPTDSGCQRRQRESLKPDDQREPFDRRFPMPRTPPRACSGTRCGTCHRAGASRPFEVNEPDRFTQGNVVTGSAADIRVRAARPPGHPTGRRSTLRRLPIIRREQPIRIVRHHAVKCANEVLARLKVALRDLGHLGGSTSGSDSSTRSTAWPAASIPAARRGSSDPCMSWRGPVRMVASYRFRYSLCPPGVGGPPQWACSHPVALGWPLGAEEPHFHCGRRRSPRSRGRCHGARGARRCAGSGCH